MLKLISASFSLFCILFIFWLSVVKVPSLKLYDNWFWDNIDKVGHFIAYGTLCFSFCITYYVWSSYKISSKLLNLLAAAAFLYSFSIEVMQYFLPYRNFDAIDLVANLLGISCSAYFFARFFR
jgi:VanZ family protein